MKTQTTTRHKFTSDYWNFTQETVKVIDPGTGEEIDAIERTHYFSKKIKLTLGLDTVNRLVVYCDEPLPIYSQLRNIVDISGTSILEDGVWQVTTTEPVLSAFGLVEGYRMRASIVSGV